MVIIRIATNKKKTAKEYKNSIIKSLNHQPRNQKEFQLCVSSVAELKER